jgi:hypothetical protein
MKKIWRFGHPKQASTVAGDVAEQTPIPAAAAGPTVTAVLGSTAMTALESTDGDPKIEINAEGGSNVYITITNNFGDGCPKKPKAERLDVVGIEIQSKSQERSKMLAIKLRTTQEAIVKFNPVDRFGKTEPLDGDLTLTVVSGDAQASVVPDSNGLKIKITPSDVPGNSVIEVSGDAQEGEGKEVITTTINVEAVHENAVDLGATLESVTDKVAPAA